MKGVEPSLLDKLFDEDVKHTSKGVFKQLSIEEYKDSVARDIESLLNNRCIYDEELLATYPECQRSLVTYGVRDFSNLSLASSIDRHYMCDSLENALIRHEKRLCDIKVDLKQEQQAAGALRFAITALLIVHPAHEPISFDAVLQPTTLRYSISRGRRSLSLD